VSSASAAATGQSVTFTAQLTPPPAGAPAATGQVQFFDGANSVGTAPVTEGGASLSLSNFTAQTHQISATYSGDMNWYSVRSAALTLTTSRGSTATALTVVFAPAQTTLAAAVTAAQGAVPVTGSLQFVDTATGAVLGASQISGGTGGLKLTPATMMGIAGHSVTAIYSGNSDLAPSTSNVIGLAAIVNAAGNLGSNFAADEFVSLYGSRLSDATQQAAAGSLPLSLAGLSISVTDSQGVVRPSGVAYVSPAQVNFVMPAGTPSGISTVAFSRNGTILFSMQAIFGPVAPGIFVTAAAQIIRVRPDGTQSVESTVTPIAMNGDPLYLVLYGTGIRGRSDTRFVTCAINGQSLPVLYAGMQSEYPGLDQVDLLLPASLRGAGRVTVALAVNGQVSNTVHVTFQ
jgi:uncharacterized protein (TIGR03437 family)